MSEEPLVSAVLCGDLNMVRCFAGDAPARAGLPVSRIPIVVASTRFGDPTFGSRHVDRRAVISEPATSPHQAAEDLVVVAERTGGKPALFYGTDSMLLCISRHRELLSRHYRFLMPPAERIEDLVDKGRFAVLARRLGLPVPRTVTSEEAKTREEVLARVSLPCAVKPVDHTSFRKSEAVREEGGLPRKALFAHTPEELDKRLEQMRKSGCAFVVQQYVRGGDDCITSFHAWMNARGEPVAHHVGKKIRTYPSGSGESTFIEVVADPEVTRVGLAVTRALGIVGVVKLDFKRDAETGELFLLEANARFNLWNRLGAASGVNLPLVAYAELTGLSKPRTGPVRPGLRWASVEGDLRAFLLDYGPSGAVSLRDFVASYRGPKVFDVFAWDDPWPLVLTLAKRVEQRASRALGKADRP